MKRHLICVFLTAILLLGWGTTSVSSLYEETNSGASFLPESSVSSTGHRPGQILLKFRAEVPEGAAADIVRARGLTISGRVGNLKVLKVAVPEGREEALIEVLSQDPRVEYAELDYLAHATIVPNDKYYSSQWAPAKIQAPGAWDIMGDTSATTIAILDTGVDLNHPDLNDKIVQGWDFINNDPVPQDDHWHGSHVAGIAAAETSNGLGVAGISWGARIMPVKVLGSDGIGPVSAVAEGILYACDSGADIINLSLGASSYSVTLKQAVQAAYGDGCLLVAAAGNEGGGAVLYPARYPETMAVAATDQDDSRAWFSNYGPEIDVAAPGVSIYSTLWDDTYGYASGTSMATPHVAGLAALVWSAADWLTNYEVQDIIEMTAVDLGVPGEDNYYGFGRINAYQAMKASTPKLTVNPHLMIFLADATMGPWPQTLLVRNDASYGSLYWDAVASEAWILLNPHVGVASQSEPGEMTVYVNKDDLVLGNTYAATITISSNTPGVQGSPQVVDVQFVYSASPLERTFLPLALRN